MELEGREAREDAGELLGSALGQDHHEFVGVEAVPFLPPLSLKWTEIPWLLAVVLLAAARFGGSALILASVSHPYGTRVVNALGVLMAGAAALLLDRLVRIFYWDGHLRRRRGRETPAVMQILMTIALVALGVSVGLYFEAGVSFTGLLTASGATALILGIALQAGISESTLLEIEDAVKQRVEEATAICKAAPPPPAEILTTDVYADGGWAWRN